MCGIIFAENRKNLPVRELVESVYEQQKERGQQGFGYAAIYNERSPRVVRSTTEDRILASLKNESATRLLFHHRQPTSTENRINACHPLATPRRLFKYKYYLIHNGIITNDDTLFDQYEKLGYPFLSSKNEGKYFTYNDSEILLYALVRYIEGLTKTVEAEGGMAFVLLQVEKNGKARHLYYGRNYLNPLYLQQNPAIFLLSSTLRPDSRMVETDTLYFWDYEQKKLFFQDDEKLKFSVGRREKYTFSHCECGFEFYYSAGMVYHSKSNIRCPKDTFGFTDQTDQNDGIISIYDEITEYEGLLLYAKKLLEYKETDASYHKRFVYERIGELERAIFLRDPSYFPAKKQDRLRLLPRP